MPCYFSFLVYLFCLMAGGSHLDRTQTSATSSSAQVSHIFLPKAIKCWCWHFLVGHRTITTFRSLAEHLFRKYVTEEFEACLLSPTSLGGIAFLHGVVLRCTHLSLAPTVVMVRSMVYFAKVRLPYAPSHVWTGMAEVLGKGFVRTRTLSLGSGTVWICFLHAVCLQCSFAAIAWIDASWEICRTYWLLPLKLHFWGE